MIQRTLTLVAILAAAPALAMGPSPYAGQEARPIASLSADDVAALEAGEGWGLAKPAELNGYPGPRHALDMAEKLMLTAAQVDALQRTYDAMNTEAKRLGAEYITAEAALDAAFESGNIDNRQVATLTADAGRLRAALRAVHLAAHVETLPLLTPHQAHIYQELRGYAGDGDAGGHAGHHRQHGSN